VFLGHFAAAFAARRIARLPSLGWLVAACQLPDLLWPLFVFAGIERFRIDPGNTAFTPIAFDHYPWSHSLTMDVVWGALLGALYLVLRRDTRGAIVIAILAVSHWVLDWITHAPDLPLLPGSADKYGLALWNNVALTMALEIVVFGVGVWLYTSRTTSRDRIGSIGWLVFAAALLLIQVANAFSPPPPSVTAVAATALALWLFVPLAAWIGRHRTPLE
jgi:membrane-bound metal-dependent hydrolase YbcI (DUF457 family)